MDDDNEFDAESYSTIKVQALIRRFLVRSRALKDVYKRYEKIFDPKRKRYYYYDKEKNKSSWMKPVLLLKKDLADVAPTYTRDQAARKLQNVFRKCMAKLKVRILYQGALTTIADEKTGKRLFYNPRSGRTFEKLPLFMKGRLDHKRKKVKKEESESDSSEDSEGLSLDSETIRQRRRLKRKFPRSKLQLIIDKCEDNIKTTIELDLSKFGAARFTSRIYDLHELKNLNISHNNVRRISANIQYLSK
jgi:hypothetical protein